MKVIAIVLFQRTKYFMQNILCAELCGQIEEWNAVTVYGIQFWFHAVLQKSNIVTCYYIESSITYWLVLEKLCLTC